MKLSPPTIDALEAEVERLERRVRELETEAVERVLTGMVSEIARSRFVMPSADELRTLAKFVRARHPAFGPHERQDEQDYEREFAAAFRALGYLNCTAAPDTKKALSYWIDGARVWLRARNLDERMTAAPLMAAAIAHGDIAWSSDRSLGLAEGVGKPCTNRWHGVLQTGEMLPPVPVPNAAPPAPPQHMGLRPTDEPYRPVASDRFEAW